jgi:hypothetical protein
MRFIFGRGPPFAGGPILEAWSYALLISFNLFFAFVVALFDDCEVSRGGFVVFGLPGGGIGGRLMLLTLLG